MAFDRSKVKGTTVTRLKEADKELKKQLGKTDRADKIELEEGTNLLRIYPVHSKEQGGGDLFAEPVVMTYLPALVQDKTKEGELLWLDKEKKQPKMKESVKPVFSAKVHGPVNDEGKCTIDKDLVEEYIKMAINKGRTLYGTQKVNPEREKYLEPIFGNFASKVNGITYQPKWIAYADLLNEETLAVKKFGDWEFKKSVHDRLTAISTIEAANDPLGTDPFTNPDEGRGVKVLYNPNAEKATEYYTTEIDNAQVPIPGTKYKGTRMLPLTDKQLEAWDKLTPLAKRFRGAFSLKDLRLQITGLELFDKKHSYGIFESDEFRDLVAAQSELFPEDPASEEADETDLPGNTAGAGAEEEEEVPEEETADQFDVMSRTELIVFNKKYGCGLRIVASMSEDEIKDKLRIWEAAQNAGSGEEEEEQVPEETEDLTKDQGNGDLDDIANGPRMDNSVETVSKADKRKEAAAKKNAKPEDAKGALGGLKDLTKKK